MSGTPSFPPVPTQLKPISHYLKVAVEHEVRDPVIAYWCRFHAVQKGLSIDKSSAEAKKLLFSLLDWLEKRKKELHSNEAITNESVAQAHLENYTLNLFHWADKMDREATFNKNVVKAFYTAGILFDVIENFGELNEEFQQQRKYAKWKAAYIHNCLKAGETPIPGPAAAEGSDDAEGTGAGNWGQDSGASASIPSTSADTHNSFPVLPQAPSGFPPTTGGNFGFVDPNAANQSSHHAGYPSAGNTVQPGTNFMPGTGTYGNQIGSNSHQAPNSSVPDPSYSAPSVGGGNVTNTSYDPTPSVASNAPVGGNVVLSVTQISKAQKYCKWAGSALNFDDVPTAIENLQKALVLLQTGKDE